MSDDAEFETSLMRIAADAAMTAGVELMTRWRRPIEVSTKSSPTDPVSEADLASERIIRAAIARARPADVIVGEEGGKTGSGELRWVIDPLDGTVNYLYGLTTFAVSIAVCDARGALAGAVLAPVESEMFTATRSGSAQANGTLLQPRVCASLDRALVSTGFGYDVATRALQAQVAQRVIPAARDIRRAGAAALDMCWCAAGRLDAYYERGIKPWDIAAGTLICQRAGLQVRTLEASGELPAGVLVAPEALAGELAALVA